MIDYFLLGPKCHFWNFLEMLEEQMRNWLFSMEKRQSGTTFPLINNKSADKRVILEEDRRTQKLSPINCHYGHNSKNYYCGKLLASELVSPTIYVEHAVVLRCNFMFPRASRLSLRVVEISWTTEIAYRFSKNPAKQKSPSENSRWNKSNVLKQSDFLLWFNFSWKKDQSWWSRFCRDYSQ